MNLPLRAALIRQYQYIVLYNSSALKMLYQLSKTLRGHEQDVRDIITTSTNELISCSRDGTVRLWDLTSTLESQILFNSSTNSFINCLAYLGDELYASGGKDNVIFINSFKDLSQDMGLFNLIGHQNNICALATDESKKLLISCSWDGTCKLWDLNTYELMETFNLQNSVLDAVFVDNSRILTASSDRLITLWDINTKQILKQFKGHEDVVRKLLILDEARFASVANDGTIKIWDFSGSLLRTVQAHDSFIYDLIKLPNGTYASSGEDRTVRFWDSDFKVLQVITLPCISNWTLSNLGNDVAVGSSDNTVRIFTTDPSKIAPQDELNLFNKSVEGSTINEQSLDNINRTDLPSYDRLNELGNEGQVVMVKSPAGVVEAHQWSGDKWNKIGDVVGSSGSNNKKMHQGKEYDYVFDVDIEDGKPPLKLPYNANENKYEVAQKFLADNDLPATYTQEVINFLQTNTEGVKLDSSGPSATPQNAPSTTQTPTVSSTSNGPRIIPVTDYIFFKEINSAQLIKGLSKFNESQEPKLATIPDQFDTGSVDAVDIIKTVVKQVFEWEPSSYLIGFDILRAIINNINISEIISDADLPELLLQFINKGIESENPSVIMMLLKFLSNLIDSVLFIQIYITTTDENSLEYNEYLSALFTKLESKISTLNSSHKHFNQMLVNLSTFVYNLTVFQIKKSIKDPQLNRLSQIKKFSSSTEASYRILISFGNLKYLKLTNDPVPNWFKQIDEPRFKALIDDIKSL